MKRLILGILVASAAFLGYLYLPQDDPRRELEDETLKAVKHDMAIDDIGHVILQNPLTSEIKAFGIHGTLIPITKYTYAEKKTETASENLLPQGAYRAEPYTGIVISPGKTNDDVMAHPTGDAYLSRIPTIEPCIRFRPLENKPDTSAERGSGENGGELK